MSYCIYNAIKTPDGTLLWCQHNHDFKLYTDKVSGEQYMNDGTGFGTRCSINTVPAEDLRIWNTDPFEKVRTAPFWGTYGKDGKSEKKFISLADMSDDHLNAIFESQKQIRGTIIGDLFLKEQEYRVAQFKDDLEQSLPQATKKNKPRKV